MPMNNIIHRWTRKQNGVGCAGSVSSWCLTKKKKVSSKVSREQRVKARLVNCHDVLHTDKTHIPLSDF